LKKSTIFLTVAIILLVSISVASPKEFEIIQNSVGIGLQKSSDIESALSGDEKCISYHIGNPASENVTAWIVVDGDLSRFHTRNEPEQIFVPSGTFRYNSSCCLLRTDACFTLPYVFKDTRIEGRVSSAFTRTSKPTTQVISATGSSVAYTLSIDVKPVTELYMNANEEKCFEFYLDENVSSYGVNNANGMYLPEKSTFEDKMLTYCFKAPFFIIFDKTYQVGLEVNDINQGNVNIIVKRNNILIIGAVVICLLAIGIVIFIIKRGRTEPSQPSTDSSSDSSFPSFSLQPLELLHQLMNRKWVHHFQ